VICSGEGGMLPEEQENNSRYFYELASGKFGFSWDLVKKVQAFHFKAGQGAKTGTGGHLPGNKVTGEIAKVRGLNDGETAISPATFTDLNTPFDFKKFADKVREITGGIPIGFKIAASHIKDDIDFALEASADDFAKALMLGADAIAVSNSALQAIGCLGMRVCGHSSLPEFNIEDLSTINYKMHQLTGINYAGIY
jgi:glutamate synthase domain-containing protein 2